MTPLTLNGIYKIFTYFSILFIFLLRPDLTIGNSTKVLDFSREEIGTVEAEVVWLGYQKENGALSTV
jgi:hypothetical protein